MQRAVSHSIGTTTTITRLSMSSSSTVPYPRAAVAVTLQWEGEEQQQCKYLLVQRAEEPDLGKWSIPGGKIEVGEPLLTAGQRELQEETGIGATRCQWYPHAFMTTDAIFKNNDDEEGDGAYQFHYLIAHCFAQTKGDNKGRPLEVNPSDDASDAKWFSLEEIQQLQHENRVSEFVLKVLQRAEYLQENGTLL